VENVNGKLYPVTKETIRYLQEQLLPGQAHAITDALLPVEAATRIVVLRQHKYYKHLVAELYEAVATKSGKLKNPLRLLNPLEELWKTENQQQVKFFMAISRFQHQIKESKTPADIEALRALVKNPAALPFYCHNAGISDNVVADAIEQVIMGPVIQQMILVVQKKAGFYAVSGQLVIDGQAHDFSHLPVKYAYFISIRNTLHVIGSFHFLKLLEFFKQQQYRLLIPEEGFAAFQQQVLAQLEEKITISYTYLKPATPKQLKEQGLDKPLEKMVYLTDSDHYVLINPVVRYGDVEIPVLSKKQVYAADSKGHLFTIVRDDVQELQFTALLLQQHPDFFEQVDNDFTYFYLPKALFLQEDWFLEAFHAWREAGIAVYGFNDIRDNRLNQHKVSINIRVTSGTNWFNTVIEAGFGRKMASLKKLHKAVRNKSRYVELGDGTLGILPQEWMDKLAALFNAGELDGEILLTPRINFSVVSQLYEEAMLDAAVKEELAVYDHRFSSFESIKEIAIPEGLNASLRLYQWQGLNWLNFLDDFNFGGCLADDMGLGKSLQIIAFILSQRTKVKTNTNLIVVPTSLLFHWQEEIDKFAPSLKVHAHYGAGRGTMVSSFSEYEVILTSYGTLVSDIEVLRNYTFNYVFADESQQIKNIDSQRYRAIRLLHCRNRIAITGTPVENNTFDLYGQLSFTCPGLLGSKQYFRDIYAIPIDKFKDSRRAKELQHKINPFMLRRTKQQVAAELPDKTEVILYAPMGVEQRKAYDAYEKELRDYLEGKRDDDLSKTAMHVLKGITKLRQICDSPALLGEETLYGNASSKIDILMEQLEEKTGRHKILVFSQFVSMLHLVEKELKKRQISFVTLTGSTVNREAVVNEFRENEQVRVFLISLKAGGTGLNLTEADYVYLIDPWWNPAVENQAIDRCYRIGQKKNVIAVRLICPDTVEEKMMKLQAAKKELVDDLIKTDLVALLRTVLASQ
jgi:SNF2 family DNA or RNA helicase